MYKKYIIENINDIIIKDNFFFIRLCLCLCLCFWILFHIDSFFSVNWLKFFRTINCKYILFTKKSYHLSFLFIFFRSVFSFWKINFGKCFILSTSLPYSFFMFLLLVAFNITLCQVSFFILIFVSS